MRRQVFTLLALAMLALPVLPAVPARRAAAPATADAAGNHTVALAATARGPRAGASAPICTRDGHWCVRLRAGSAGAGRIELSSGTQHQRSFQIPPLPERMTVLSTVTIALWPHIVVEPDGAVIIGVEQRTDGANQQGEWATGELLLLRAGPGAAPLRQVLDVPLLRYIGIYACLHRGDSRLRFGACIDKALLTGMLSFDPRTRTGRPRFRFEVRARTFPAHGVLEREMDRQIPLRRSDIRWAIDPECSYRQHMAYDPRQGLYVGDTYPRPCQDYFGH